jgi:hypothetical protein
MGPINVSPPCAIAARSKYTKKQISRWARIRNKNPQQKGGNQNWKFTTFLLTGLASVLLVALPPVRANAQAWRNCIQGSIAPGGCESIAPGGGLSIVPWATGQRT